MPLSQNGGNLFVGDEPLGGAHHHVEGIVIRGIQRDPIQTEEDNDGEPPQPCVAVDEGMVADDGLQQYGGLRIEADVRFAAKDDDGRSVSSRIEQPQVVYRPHAEVGHESQEILGGQVLSGPGFGHVTLPGRCVRRRATCLE